MNPVDVLMHPARHRIITVLSHAELSFEQVAEALPDIPKPSLYRHINRMIEADLIEVLKRANPKSGLSRILKTSPSYPKMKVGDTAHLTANQHESAVTNYLLSQLTLYSASNKQSPERAGDWNLASVHIQISPQDQLELTRQLKQFVIDFAASREQDPNNPSVAIVGTLPVLQSPKP
jgi:DNA-binding transcriptional ArsR family regulator